MTEESSTRTTRLSGELDERYENYRDELDMTDAEALRSLIRDGLAVNDAADEQRDVTALEQVMYTVSLVVVGLNFLLLPLAVAGLLSPWVATTSGFAYLVVGSSIAAAAYRGVFRFSEDAADEAPSAAREVAD